MFQQERVDPWDLIGSGCLHNAQRGDEESRRNRVYKNFIREKGQHNKWSKQSRWKRKYVPWHNREEAQLDQSFSSSYSEEEEVVALDDDSGVVKNESETTALNERNDDVDDDDDEGQDGETQKA